MKKLIAFPLSWILFALGDFVWRVLCQCDDLDRWVGIWYPPYNYLMIWSGNIQKWAGGNGVCWPWELYATPEQE